MAQCPVNAQPDTAFFARHLREASARVDTARQQADDIIYMLKQLQAERYFDKPKDPEQEK